MRLLRRSETGEFSLTDDLLGDDPIPPYAILSHTWGPDTEEVTFEDMTKGTWERKRGYEKIKFCGEQAKQDDLQYFWIDTCCINKNDPAELSRSITSMFRWYRNATRCYVYLTDVSSSSLDINKECNPRLWESDLWKTRWFAWYWISLAVISMFRWCPKAIQRYVYSSDVSGPPLDSNDVHNPQSWESSFGKSRWFTRGWTLQELLAPASVEFFSLEHKRLGDKNSLREQIHLITNIPYSALQGDPLSQFSIWDRWQWIEHRQTKLEEDKVYSLLGIFGVYIPPSYGEGAECARSRLFAEFDKVQKCTQELHLTDPRDDKKRIEDTKGGLLEGSYYWILENSQFKQWRDDQQSRLLWIKGDPGKGKTMLLCGIINELKKPIANTKSSIISYFFCQANDSRINNATAVLRGLIYLLVCQQQSLISHIQSKYDAKGKSLFENENAWVALSEIFKDMLQDLNLETTYLVVDGLDECVTGLPNLLDLIVRTSSSSSSARVKWLLSSRGEPHIEHRLLSVGEQARLSLELKENAEQVSCAVNAFIEDKLSRIDSFEDSGLRDQVRDILRQKANGTFLWVALVVKELEDPETLNPLQTVEDVPTGLRQMYNRMVKRIQQLSERNAEVCRLMLSIATVAYRPLHLTEIGSLCGLTNNVRKVVAMCGSFLTIRDNQVYIIHQSAKDYLHKEAPGLGFPSHEKTHHNIFLQSLELMSGVLHRDMYRIITPSISIEEVQIPAKDPLATTRYSCVHWIDHLCNAGSDHKTDRDGHDWDSYMQDGGKIYNFLQEKYLYWLEALSLCRSMSEGVVSIAKLETLVLRREEASALMELVHDARRFTVYHKSVIENYPLQTYASALLFSPTGSLIRNLFKKEEPTVITAKPAIGDRWSSCLQTLEDHNNFVRSVAVSHDLTRLASSSSDKSIKIWDTGRDEYLSTPKDHSNSVTSLAFSYDLKWLALVSDDGTVSIWDTSSGKCMSTLISHCDPHYSILFSHISGIFSHNSTRLAWISSNNIVKIWDVSNNKCLSTLKGHSDWISLVAFAYDSIQLASASHNRTVRLWDTNSGTCLLILEGHNKNIWSIAFSPDSTRLALASEDGTIKIWGTSSDECLSTVESHSDSGPVVRDYRGECLSTLKGHLLYVYSVAFSHDSTRLASASGDGKFKIWDVSSGTCLHTLEHYDGQFCLVAFSPDSTRLASSSKESVKIWDASSGECLQRFKTGKVLFKISFDPTGSYLHTEIGTLAINASDRPLASTTTLDDTSSRCPEYRGGGLSGDMLWITYNSENIVRLPSEYRPLRSVVSGNNIGVVTAAGKLWMCQFEPDRS